MLKGKAVVITGGTRGLGLLIAEAFAAEGANVVCASRTCPVTEAIPHDQAPARIVYDRVDVSDPGSVAALMTRTVEKYGRLDVVVANAGVSADGKVTDLAQDAWQSTIDTNLNGTFYAIQAAASQMRTQGEGRIITMSSSMASRPTVGTGAYAASKAAIETLTRVAAIELGRDGIRVNCIAPGVLDVGLGAELEKNPKLWQRYFKKFGSGRPGTGSEVARVALFLAGPESSYVNGTTIEVNGALAW